MRRSEAGIYQGTRTWKSSTRLGLLAAILALAACAPMASSQSVIVDTDEKRILEDFDWLPFAFSSESFGVGFGIGMGYSGWPQEQASLLGAITLGTEGAYNVMGILSDWQAPGIPRLVIEPMFSFGKYQNQRLHIGQGFEPGSVRAGANGSDSEEFIEVSQWDNRVEIDFQYLLPIGNGADTIVNRYVIDKQGLLVKGGSGGESWNPLESGRTKLSIVPSWREQTESAGDVEVPFETINATFAVEHDNYDFPFNPGKGSFKKLSYTKDFDDHVALGGWSSWTAEANKVFSLPNGENSLQRLIALGFWTSYVPTWETENVDGTVRVTERPPHFEGATLGGIDRMRAYEDHRYQDKAAIYYTAEYRTMPTWQPLKNVGWLDFADVSWWQWVVFAEAGQVAPTYTLDALHDDLRWDGGVSIRAMISKAVCRLDVAVGEEGGRVVAMYGHPF